MWPRGRGQTDVYVPSTVSRCFGAETKMYGDVRIAEQQKVNRDDDVNSTLATYFSHYTCIMWKDM